MLNSLLAYNVVIGVYYKTVYSAAVMTNIVRNLSFFVDVNRLLILPIVQAVMSSTDKTMLYFYTVISCLYEC